MPSTTARMRGDPGSCGQNAIVTVCELELITPHG
jgi:hypothetical protein